MTATKAMIGKNSKFSWRVDGVTTAYALVGEITNITPTPRSRDTQEATHMASPADAEEHIHGLIRTGDASFTLNLEPDEEHVVEDMFAAPKGDYQIAYPNGIRMQFFGIASGLTYGEITPEGKLTVSFTARVSRGVPALLAAEAVGG
jgi:hypothetical protein